jgi:hypothetical protein
MLKTRTTEQYRLKVPFINAGMAFIPRPWCGWSARRVGWECRALPQCLPACFKRRSASQSSRPSMFRGQCRRDTLICSRQSSIPSLLGPSSLQGTLPMAGPLLLRWRSTPMGSGWGPGS